MVLLKLFGTAHAVARCAFDDTLNDPQLLAEQANSSASRWMRSGARKTNKTRCA